MSSHPPDRFQSAHDEREVVNVLRDALRHWEPEELARLPESCRPGKIRDGEDIANHAFILTTTRIESDESDEMLIQLETLFAHACRRISQVEGGGARGRGGDIQESR
jgi:hypothetical protein